MSRFVLHRVRHAAFVAAAALSLAGGALLGAPAASAQQPYCGYDLQEFTALQENGFGECSISVDKEVLGEQGTFHVGDVVTFRITVENTGDVWIYDVGVVDEYDSDALLFLEADVEPSEFESGLIVWEELDDGEGLGPEDSVTIDVAFRVTDTGESVENCALSFATADVYEYEGGVDIDSGEFDCARIDVIDEPQGGGDVFRAPGDLRTPTPRPTSTPLTEPTPVSTVAGATAVATRPAGITLPDTGAGASASGSGSGAAAYIWAIGAFLAVLGGAAIVLRRAATR